MPGFIERAFMLCILAFQAASVKAYTSDRAGCLMPEAAGCGDQGGDPGGLLAPSIFFLISPLGSERKKPRPLLSRDVVKHLPAVHGAS